MKSKNPCVYCLGFLDAQSVPCTKVHGYSNTLTFENSNFKCFKSAIAELTGGFETL